MIIAIILTALLLIFLFLLLIIYNRVFYYPYKNLSEIHSKNEAKNPYGAEIARRAAALYERPYEKLTIRSFDGLTLCGRYFHHADGAKLCICCHGFHGSPSRDFSAMGPILMDAGYNVILIEERAHWNSGGHTISYGLRERRDILGWINFANERFGSDTPIYLFGLSMGAAAVLMTSGFDLPANVRAICADCPFNDPLEEILFVTEKFGLNPKIAKPLIILSALIYGRLNIRETSAAEEVKKTKTPILIIHGESDTLVPVRMSAEVHASNPDRIEYHTFPGAGHGTSYFTDTDRYLRIVFDFLRRHP